MKKLILNISIIGSVLVSMGALQSCSDALETNLQPGTVEDDGTPFKTTDALYNYMMGNVYGTLEPQYPIHVSAVLSDEVKPGSSSGGQEFSLHRYFLTSQEPRVAEIWQNNYAVINHVNRLVRGAEGITTSSDADQTRLNQIVAQARAMRAYAYLQLESLFSTDMKDPNALGVLLVKDVPDLDAKLPRVKNSDIYAFIEADLTFARNTLTAEGTNQYFIGKSAVNAISARYFLYKGDYAQAKTYATAVVNAASAGGFGLTKATPITMNNPITSSYHAGNPSGLPRDYVIDGQENPATITLTDANGVPLTDSDGNQLPPVAANNGGAWRNSFYGQLTTNVGTSFNPYRQMWVDQNRGESILSLGRIALGGNGQPIGSVWNTNSSSLSGAPMWFWGRNLYNLFLEEYGDVTGANVGAKGDVRFLTNRDPTTSANTNYASLYPNNLGQTRMTDRLVIDKYPGKAGTNVRNDIKLFRLSEMYFILAECAVNDGQLTVAADYIKAIKDARNFRGTAVLPVYATAQAAWAGILKERRMELALEGHRLIDLKRLAVKAGVKMDRNNTDDIVLTSNLENGDYRYTLPIPLSEISANPNAQQNPGYNN
ncbi:RagB/SusD family nutrient uptake outer membrane protein [Chryseobacterium sp. MYb264]|uniref:RagB/SusD family nutrient uptake outer membrane protein n=1 Tax=Chryseobacterium sp. MYb264 TaxID=2745153 RepID=UPI002E100721|nr:RagB/SusD family nutrient uptake outer membrane protein [Chryseobacterium sp. MYb264]